MRFIDPSGHMCSDPEDLSNSMCDGSGDTRSGDHIIPGNHVGGGMTPGTIDLFLETKILLEIDRRLDPYKGSIPGGVEYEGSIYLEYDLLAMEAYYENGIDIYYYAENLLDNPTDQEFWLNTSVPIDYLYSKGLWGKSPGAEKILSFYGLSTENFSNYEPNYLNAILEVYPENTPDIRADYYYDLLEQYGGLLQAWEFLQMTIDLAGTVEPGG